MDATAVGLLVGLIAVALVFDFLNGLHDAANSIATIVSTRVLPPKAAVFWALSSTSLRFFLRAARRPDDWNRHHRPSGCQPPSDLRRTDGRDLWNVITWWAGIPSVARMP
jgi:PiT family inorganic phosphate transporter